MQTISELERTLQFVKKKDKVDTLIELAGLYLDSDLQRASQHARTAKKLARKLKLKKKEAAASRLAAQVFFRTSRYRNAIDLLGESLSLTRNADDMEGLSSTLLELGKNHYKLTNYDKSVESYHEALSLALEQKDNFLQAQIMNNLALIKIVTADYAEAKDYLLKVIKIWKNRDYEAGIFNALLNLGIIAFRQGKIDEARSQTNKALELAEKLGKENYIGAATNSLGMLLIEEDNYEKALDLLLEYAEVLEENDQAVWVYADILNNISTCYLRLSDLEQAKDHAKRSLQIAREIESRLMIVKNLEIISQLALEQEDYKLAYESTNELHELKKLIYDKEVAAKIAAVRLKSGADLKTSRTALTAEKRTLSENVLDQRILEIIQADEQFQLIVESSEDIITLHDRKGKYLYCNKPYLFSIKAEDLSGKSPYNFYKFEYADALVRQIKYTYSSGKSNQLDSLIEIEGQEKWFSNYIYPVTDIDGNVVAVAMLSRYRSEPTEAPAEAVSNLDDELLKQMEELKQKQLIWESFREDVRDFVTFRVELNDEAPVKQKVIFYSSSLKIILGINLVDDFAQWFKNIHKDEKDKLIEDFRKAVAQALPLHEEVRIFHPELKEYRWIEIRLDPAATKGKVDYLNGVITDITSRKEAEITLNEKLESIKLNRELLQISSQAYVLTDLDGSIVDYNRALPELTGYSVKAVAELNWLKDLTKADFLPEEKEVLETLRAAGKHQVFEKTLPAKNDRDIQTEINVHAILNDEGKIYRYCYFITDISSRNKLIAQLRNNNKELNSLLESLPAALLELGSEGLIKNIVLTPLTERLGLNSDLEGKGLDSIFPADSLSEINRVVKQCNSSGQPVAVEFMFDDQMLQAEAVKGKNQELLLFLSDISNLKEAESKLAKSKKKFQEAFQQAPQPLCLVNNSLQIETANQSFIALTGLEAAELEGKELQKLLPEDQLKTFTEMLSSDSSNGELEFSWKNKKTGEIPVKLNFNFLRNEAGEISQIFTSWQNLTPQKQQLDELTAQFQAKEKVYQEEIKDFQQKIDEKAAEHQKNIEKISRQHQTKIEKKQNEISQIETNLKQEQDDLKTQINELQQQLSDLRKIRIEPSHYANFRLDVELDSDKPLRVVNCSNSLKKLTGTETPEDFADWFTHISESDRTILDNSLKALIGSAQSMDVTLQLQHPDLKRSLWLRMIAEPVKVDGQLSAVNGILIDVSTTKLTEAELQEKLTRSEISSVVLNEIDQPFAVFDPEGNIKEVNNAFCQQTGYKRKELTGRSTWNKLLTENGLIEFSEIQFKQQETWIDEVELQPRKGQPLAVKILLHPYYNAAGELLSVFCFMIDISALQLTISELKQADTGLRTLFNELPLDIMVLDHNSTILEILNLSPVNGLPLKLEHKGKKLQALFPKEAAEAIGKGVRECLSQNASLEIEYNFKTADQQSWQLGRFHYKSEDAVYFFCSDITEQHLLQEEVYKLKTEFQNIFGKSPIALFTLDAELNILELNPAAEELTGKSKKELLQKNLRSLETDQYKLLPPYQEVLKGNSIESLEQELEKNNNELSSFINYSIPVTNEKDEVKLIQSFWVDISDRKLIEQELRLKKTDLEKSEEKKIENYQKQLDTINKLLSENTDFALFSLTADTADLTRQEITYTSPTLKKLLQLKVLGDLNNWATNIAEEQQDGFFKLVENCLQECESASANFLVKERWLRLDLNATQLNDDQIVLNGIFLNVTGSINRVKKLETELEKTSASSQFLEDSPLAFARSNSSDKMLAANQAFCKLSGYKADELLAANSWIDLLGDKQLKEDKGDLIQSLLAENTTQRTEVKLISKKGAPLNVELTLFSSTQAEKEEYLIFANDVAERKSQLLKLERSEAEMQNIISKMPYDILELDHNGKVRNIINSTGEDKFLQEIDPQKASLHNIYPGKAADKILSSLQKCLKDSSHTQISFPVQTKDQQFWYKAQLLTKNDDAILYIPEEISNNVTLEKNYQELLKKYENNLAACPVPFLTLDPDLKISYLNDAAGQLLDLTVDEGQGKSICEFDPAGDRISGKLTKVTQGNTIINIEEEIITAGQEPVSILNFAYPYKDESGKVIQINCMWVDISDRKLIEKELNLQKAGLERSVDDNIKELTEKLNSYETFLQENNEIGLFQAQAVEKKYLLTINNKAIFKLMGTKSTTDLQKLMSNLPEDISGKIIKLIESKENRKQTLIETVQVKTDKPKWLKLCLNFPPKLKKSARRVQGIVFDVTDQILKEKELTEAISSINRGEEIIYASEQAFVVLSKDLQLLNYNPAFQQLSGFSTEELGSLKWAETIGTAATTDAENKYLNQLTEKNTTSYQRTFRTGSGNDLEVEIKAHVNSSNNSEFYLFITDLTEITVLNTDLQSKVEDLNSVVKQLPGYSIQLDPELRVKRILGSSLQNLFPLPKKAAGKDLNEIIPEEFATNILKFSKDYKQQPDKDKIELSWQKEDKQYWFKIETKKLNKNDLLLNITDISKFKQAEIELKKESSPYKSLFQNTPLPVFTLSPDGKFTYANQEGLELLGYKQDELLQMKFKDLELFEHGSASASKKLLQGEELINFEHKIKGKDGRQFTVLHNAYIIKNKQEKTSSIQIALINITAQKKREEELQLQLTGTSDEVQEQITVLKNSLRNYEAFFNDAESYAVFRFSLDSQELNKQKLDLKSPSLHSIVENHEIKVFKDLLKNVIEEDRKKIESSCQSAIAEQHSLNEIFRIRSDHNDQIRWINLSFDPVANKTGNYSANGFIQDITRLKETEFRLQENENLLINTIAAVPFAIYTTSPTGKFTYLSPSFKKLFELAKDQKAISWQELMVDDPENKKARKIALDALTTGKSVQPYNLQMSSIKGRKFTAEIREAAVVSSGDTDSIVGVIKDISSREKLEAELDLMKNATSVCELVMIITDPQLGIIFANQSTAELLGINNSQELIDKDLTDYLKVEDNSKFKRQLHQDLLKVSNWQNDLEVITSDNTIIRKTVTISSFKGWQDKEFLAISFKEVIDTADLEDQIEFIREELQKQKEKELKLLEEQKLLEDAIGIAGIGVWTWNIKKDEIQCSEGFFQILGLKITKRVIDLDLFKQFIHPEQEKELTVFLKKASNTKEMQELKLKTIDPEGNTKDLELHTITSFETDQPGYLLGVVYELEKLPAGDKAAKAVKEPVTKEIPAADLTTPDKIVSLQQQVITHLIDESPDFSSKPKNLFILKDIQERAEIVMLIMQLAMNSKDPSVLVFQSFLQNLLQNFGKKLGSKKLISMRINAKKIKLPMEQALPCGLIIHELVSNSVKYAFPKKRKSFYESTIKIDMIFEDGQFILSVSDNGVGLPQDFDLETDCSTGLKLVKLWTAQQLHGTVSIDPEHKPGTAFKLVFK